MPTLRLTQHEEKENQYSVEIVVEKEKGKRRKTDVTFPFEMTPEDRRDLRWYLEDYLQYPMDPAPEIAKRVEARITELGKSLFASVFHGNDARRQVQQQLDADQGHAQCHDRVGNPQGRAP